MYFNKAVPENDPDYRHDDEGPDDMPAHLKGGNAGMLGNHPYPQRQAGPRHVAGHLFMRASQLWWYQAPDYYGLGRVISSRTSVEEMSLSPLFL
jgi:hypothetical protein